MSAVDKRYRRDADTGAMKPFYYCGGAISKPPLRLLRRLLIAEGEGRGDNEGLSRDETPGRAFWATRLRFPTKTLEPNAPGPLHVVD